MNGPRIRYNTQHQHLEQVLKSIDYGGDYFAAGRLELLPPQMTVSAVGKLAFPLPGT